MVLAQEKQNKMFNYADCQVVYCMLKLKQKNLTAEA